LLFKPGSCNVDVNVGFYTQVLGLGLSPDDVTINGAVHAEADCSRRRTRRRTSGEARKTSPSTRTAALTAGPSRRPRRTGACTSAATSRSNPTSQFRRGGE
jgi:hypothetical protein